jgi:hypothetical protein
MIVAFDPPRERVRGIALLGGVEPVATAARATVACDTLHRRAREASTAMRSGAGRPVPLRSASRCARAERRRVKRFPRTPLGRRGIEGLDQAALQPRGRGTSQPLARDRRGRRRSEVVPRRREETRGRACSRGARRAAWSLGGGEAEPGASPSSATGGSAGGWRSWREVTGAWPELGPGIVDARGRLRDRA